MIATDDPNALHGKRVLVIGLGSRQGGLGVTRYLARSGAHVRVTDRRTADDLSDVIAELGDLPVEYTLGEHRAADIEWADVIVRNPAVPAESPWLELARQSNKRIEMEMTLFLRACPAPVLGVTGTKGKTTTTTLLAAMLRERWPNAVLAGNMGVSALTQLPSIDPSVPVALELSSFQLEGLDEHRLSPHVAVLTNLSPDHLDRYPTYAEYVATKAAIFRHQVRGDWAIFRPADAGEVFPSGDHGNAQVAMVDERNPTGDYALWIADEHFVGRWDGRPIDLGPVSSFVLPGKHAHMNVLAAAGAALAAGVMPDDITTAIANFRGVPHRLEVVATIDGVTYVNDTAATAPAAAVAALHAFAGRRIIAIAGGSDKRLPMEPLAEALAESAASVILLDGTATPTLQALLRERGVRGVDGPFPSMAAAVERATEVATPGSIVLLSPGTASFGMFRDEFHRGDAFREAVRRYEQRGDR